MARKAKKILKVDLDSYWQIKNALERLNKRLDNLEKDIELKRKFNSYCCKVTVVGSILQNPNTGTRYVVESIEDKELNTSFLMAPNPTVITVKVAHLRSETSGYRKSVCLDPTLYSTKFNLLATPKAAHVLYGGSFDFLPTEVELL